MDIDNYYLFNKMYSHKNIKMIIVAHFQFSLQISQQGMMKTLVNKLRHYIIKLYFFLRYNKKLQPQNSFLIQLLQMSSGRITQVNFEIRGNFFITWRWFQEFYWRGWIKPLIHKDNNVIPTKFQKYSAFKSSVY